MKTRNPFSVILASAVLSAASIRAGDGHAHGPNGSHAPAGGKPKFQTHCPVTGSAARRDFFADHEGLRVYLCSATCSQEFGKDPAKHIATLKKQGVTVSKLQTTCPVTGNAIKKSAYVDLAGLRIYLCSEKCAGTLKANPGKYVKRQLLGGVAFDSPPSTGHEGHGHGPGGHAQ
ncbi:MAG: hypothetical protein HN849_32730 [Victivallales bacterium]|jgi:YHS domain-containing protein|nr:hypothetical protein [Victivallales bacterium]